MANLEDMLKQIMGGDDGNVSVRVIGGTIPDRGSSEWEVTIAHEAQIEELKAMAYDYGRPVFKKGDIVTPKRQSGTKGAGLPHIVLETNYGCEPYWTEDGMSARNGRRHEVRVMCYVNNEQMIPFWGESHEYEPYDPKVHGK